MARIADIERRLLNWARYEIAMRGRGSFARIDLTQPNVDNRSPYDSQVPIGIMEGEAKETADAVEALEESLRKAVREHYFSTRGVPEQARALGIGKSTLYARIEQAHRVIARWLAEREQAAQQEAKRVRALQPGAQAPTPPPVRSPLGEHLQATRRARGAI